MQPTEIIVIFNRAIADYHLSDSVTTSMANPYPETTYPALLYEKTWIDTVQWHLEDLIRNPHINPTDALELKRKIDAHNQLRTDIVEKIEDVYALRYQDVPLAKNAILNTETIGWALDRLSILCLKIYHMAVETKRLDVSEVHIRLCLQKLTVLREQQSDLTQSITQLLTHYEQGKVQFKLYRQMKMYNDPKLNPVLYNNAKR